MSLLEARRTILNTRNIAIMEGVGITAAGLFYWAFDDPEYRLNDKLALKIQNEMIKQIYPYYWHISDFTNKTT